MFCYGFPTAKAMNHVRQRVREEIGRDVRRPLSEMIKYLRLSAARRNRVNPLAGLSEP